jgi:lysozyme
MNRETIFGTVRTILGRGFSRTEVDMLDRAIDAAARGEALSPAPPGLHIGEAGKALIKKWEGCARRRADGKVEAYPDPGSADGKPWTIGWGATGPGIGPGTVWTQAQCEERFEHDIVRFAEAVAKAIGDAPTTQNQFDALVSFHYNTGAIAKATLTKLHRRGDHAGAAREFGKWINNDGKPMAGLVKRRADEAALYSTRRY